MSILAFDSVSKIYRKGFRARRVTAVSGLCFRIEEPGIYGFVGPNGAGKTTSIKMLLGLVRPTSGTVSIRGQSATLPAARRGVAFVSEQPYLYQYLTARESLRFSWRLSGFAPAGMEAAIDRSLARVGLADQGAKRVREFSKGMQQRLNMAQALLGDAELYVFDEPMSGLDPLGRRLFRELFRELGQEGKCVFFSTHILEDIATLCDHVVALSGGKLVYDGPIADLLSRGYTGTEIVVEQLPAPLDAELLASGFGLSRLQTGATQILAASHQQSAACLRLLYGQDILPLSVNPRSQPIESILYGGQQKEADA